MNSTAIPLRPVARLAPVLPEALLLLTIVTGLVLRWIWWDEFTYSVFTDRDLLRSLFLWDDEFPYTASEIGRRTARSLLVVSDGRRPQIQLCRTNRRP